MRWDSVRAGSMCRMGKSIRIKYSALKENFDLPVFRVCFLEVLELPEPFFFHPWIFTYFNSDVYHQQQNSGRTHANGELKSAGVATIRNSCPIHFSMAEIATHTSYTKVCFSGCSTNCVIHYKYLQFIVLITYGLEYHSLKGLGNHSE